MQKSQKKHVQEKGITFSKVACLARCNGASVEAHRADEETSSLAEFRRQVTRTCAGDPDAENFQVWWTWVMFNCKWNLGGSFLYMFFSFFREGSGYSLSFLVFFQCFEKIPIDYVWFCFDILFWNLVKHTPNSITCFQVMIVSYSRKALGQTGDGHYSPIGGYHAESDQVLILDVARCQSIQIWDLF